MWKPVAEDDWKVAQDSAKGIRDAVMLFEKVYADESRIESKECRLRVYRRVKIFSARGKGWAWCPTGTSTAPPAPRG